MTSCVIYLTVDGSIKRCLIHGKDAEVMLAINAKLNTARFFAIDAAHIYQEMREQADRIYKSGNYEVIG